MVSTDDFLNDLRRFHLLDPAQLEECTRDLQGETLEPRLLARRLIERNQLTPYQVNQLFQGRGQELVLGSYLLLQRLGAGGMGTVFKARNWKLGHVVALKVIHKERVGNADAVRRFQREIRAAAQLDHPHIVRAFDADEVGGAYLLVMEFVEGIDLSRLVKEQGPLPVAQACDAVRQAALGLQHAFEKGMVHRDIKPHNLLLAASPVASAPGVVKILDMGLARLGGPEGEGEPASVLTLEGAVMGTPDYLAPEQARGAHDVDIRADLYSLGCTLYFLLAGRPPFTGGTLSAKLIQHQLDEPEPIEKLRPEVPPALAAIIRKLMAKRPENRYQTPAEVAAVLAAVDLGGAAPGRPVAPAADALGSADTVTQAFAYMASSKTVEDPHSPRQQALRRRLLWNTAAIVALLLALVALIVFAVGTRPRRASPDSTEEKDLPEVVRENPLPPAPPPLDLLALVDPARDTVRGYCRKADGQLEIAAHRAVLAVRGEVPEEYELTAVVRRVKGKEGLGIDLPVAGVRARLVIDGYGGERSGLSPLSGKQLDQIPSTRVGRLLVEGKPATVVVRVGKDRVEADCNGRRIASWQGDPQGVAVTPELLEEDPRLLQLEVLKTGTLALERLELVPAGQPGAKIDLLAGIDPQRDTLSGTWRFETRTLTGVSDEQPVIRLPYAPPAEYRLTVYATWIASAPHLRVLLSQGERRFMAVIDNRRPLPGPEQRLSGLALLDGKLSHLNETTLRTPIMPRHKTVRLTFTVQPDHVRVACDDHEFIHYEGSLDRLSLSREWETLPADVPLALMPSGSCYRISRVTLEPLGTDPGRALFSDRGDDE